MYLVGGIDMRIYIVEGSVGQWSDTYTWIHRAFYKKSDAETFIQEVDKFSKYAHDNLRRACCYELYKIGVMYGWKEDYEDVPFFIIQETELI